MPAYALFPARVPFTNKDGTLTNAAIQAFQHITDLLGGTNNVLPNVIVLTVQDGTASSPGFVFDSDRDTGLYLVGDGVMGVATAGAQRVEISSNGLAVPLLTDSAFTYIGSDGYFKSVAALNGEFLIGQSGDVPVIGSIAGVANRTEITNDPGAITVDISAAYSGQASITTVGAIASGTWEGSTIAADHGGTGLSSYTVGDLLYASGAAALSKLAAVAAGNVLRSGGVGSAPAWGKVDLAADVTGVLPAANLPQALATTSNPTFNSLALTNGFGCNGASPQTEAAVSVAISATAGAAYTASEQAMMNSLKTLVNQLRAALVANGIAV